MNKVVPLVMAAVLAVTAFAAEAIPPRGTPAYEAWARKMERIDEVQPMRREDPLRYENITDEEVREIQLAARNVVPRALVNISGVTTGCPCEDGPECSDQVWIVAYRPDKSVGLLLSRIEGHWVIGPVQRWWLLYNDLESRRRTFKSFSAYLEAEQKLVDVFPVCTLQVAVPPNDGSVTPSQ